MDLKTDSFPSSSPKKAADWPSSRSHSSRCSRTSAARAASDARSFSGNPAHSGICLPRSPVIIVCLRPRPAFQKKLGLRDECKRSRNRIRTRLRPARVCAAQYRACVTYDDSSVPKSAAEQSAVSRRAFVKLAAAGSVAVVFGVDRGGKIIAALDKPAPAAGLLPNQWIRIDQNGRVTIRAHKSEMGQGVRTSLPAVVAAELGADWSNVHVEHAEPGPQFADMGTSGSGSVSDSWQMLREAAAVARALLISAAATRWRVAPADCDTAKGRIIR